MVWLERAALVVKVSLKQSKSKSVFLTNSILAESHIINA